ncbi:hypothetical protein OOT46_16875 [Aquabacterium sp. A7-Y]|uniref:hypothetical protein n=1 Tax=Aquabacterium sp. A7-Y TaxID=1349605 RepID=UPI00223D3C55|nr:hypothetical protein [Aquabacterium sp. A7-Y]MCW7539518.1 hypothetical protein [Aquabacterium sp. A7-Y]
MNPDTPNAQASSSSPEAPGSQTPNPMQQQPDAQLDTSQSPQRQQQQASQERGPHTNNKKNAGKRPSQGGSSR